MELVPADARKAVYGVAKLVGCNESGDFVMFPKAINGLKCKVKYRTLTKAGYLRLPSFIEFAC